jgi:hypothetical protein
MPPIALSLNRAALRHAGMSPSARCLWDGPLGMMDVMRRFVMFGMLPRVYLGCANRLGVSSA